MSFSLSTVTGSAQTGLTSPTFTVTADVAPDSNGKQYAITALGGTQLGVVAHSVSNPFTVTYARPKSFRTTASNKNGSVGRNSHSFIVRKGLLIDAISPPQVLLIKMTIDVPAGAEYADPSSIRSAVSAAIGALSQASSGIGDTLVNGVM